jgi:hypothetical protein
MTAQQTTTPVSTIPAANPLRCRLAIVYPKSSSTRRNEVAGPNEPCTKPQHDSMP